MAAITKAALSSPTKGHLRPFDIRRDLVSVADLVELSFNDTIDADGHRYLRQMRDAARNPGFLRWAGAVVEQTSLPLSGYIWEEDGRVVGNLSLIPITIRSRRCYLIANVAVHPNYRRHGIGRALTAAALEHARSRRAQAAWLHVREENEPAVALYRSLGFLEQTRRTSWYNQRQEPEYSPFKRTQDSYQYLPVPEGVKTGPRWGDDWSLQRSWLLHTYPPSLSWNLPLNLNLLQPGLVGALYRLLSGSLVRQFAVRQGENLLGVISWRRSYSSADTLWLALPPNHDEGSVQALLLHALRQLPWHRMMTLDMPARVAAQALKASGFYEHQTLIWMYVDIDSKR
ncbi:MAG: GNAT family N-acetyltransferase [Chloroflexota bacterium]|nr:MAG: GNAT family N-acetyltransferase [Chloroflexota bacterium]